MPDVMNSAAVQLQLLRPLVVSTIVLTLMLPGAANADMREPPTVDAFVGPVRDKGPDEQPASDRESPALNWDTGEGRSYLVPGAGILAYLFLLNRYDRHLTEPQEVYRTNGDTIWRQLTDSKWVLDNDRFSVNQFLHPYGGSVYYGLARSAGLSFGESFLYSTAGSFLWEIGGETSSPSINDMIITPIGGSFLGEPLFRMANLLLETDDGRPALWRQIGAAVISPATAFNRLVFGDRFDAVFPSHQPATFLRLQAGGTLTSSSQNVSSSLHKHGAVGDITFTYGLPGKPGYGYTRPFDYFDFHLTAVTANTLESLNTRGLLLGAGYGSADATRGVWGLFGSYDYISPQVFRVSTAALSLGTVWQSWVSRDIALQGTALGGAGYGAAGSIELTEERDYHYGASPQGLLALRLIFGDRAMIDVTGREYYVSSLLSSEPGGQENILRGDASFTLRVFDHHGVALRYHISHRDAHYRDAEFRNQTIETISLMYVFLGATGFGSVEWR